MPDQSQTVFPLQRPRGLRWLCAALAGVGLVNLGTALRTMQFASAYAALAVAFPPVLQVVLSLEWGIGFLWGAWRLWRLRNGSDRWVLVLVGVYGLCQIVWWRSFARSDYALARWPFAALGTVLLAAWVWRYLRRPRVRALFCAKRSAVSLAQSSGEGLNAMSGRPDQDVEVTSR
jgi:hypothetical protein